MRVTPVNKEKKMFKVEFGWNTVFLTLQEMIILQALLQKELNNIKF